MVDCRPRARPEPALHLASVWVQQGWAAEAAARRGAKTPGGATSGSAAIRAHAEMQTLTGVCEGSQAASIAQRGPGTRRGSPTRQRTQVGPHLARTTTEPGRTQARVHQSCPLLLCSCGSQGALWRGGSNRPACRHGVTPSPNAQPYARLLRPRSVRIFAIRALARTETFRCWSAVARRSSARWTPG